MKIKGNVKCGDNFRSCDIILDNGSIVLENISPLPVLPKFDIHYPKLSDKITLNKIIGTNPNAHYGFNYEISYINSIGKTQIVHIKLKNFLYLFYVKFKLKELIIQDKRFKIGLTKSIIMSAISIISFFIGRLYENKSRAKLIPKNVPIEEKTKAPKASYFSKNSRNFIMFDDAIILNFIINHSL